MKTIVYRHSTVRPNEIEIGEMEMEVTDIRRDGADHWCDRRICKTWDEGTALRIVRALQKAEKQ